MIAILSVAIFFASHSLVRADDNFDASLNSTYTVNDNGNTTIQQKFTLTNKKATVFAQQYALEVGATKLQNVRVFDDKGDIPSNVVVTQNKTSIGITFADKVVGEGKSRTFTIQFNNPDTAIISGNVLEVYIPKFSNAHDYSDYQVILKTPIRFGKPARVTPQNYTTQESAQFETLTFSHIGNLSISALFGQKQIFDYTLKYNLENPTGTTGVIQVALPPDTLQQKVQYQDLQPQPQEINRDADGNWIATYQIEAQKNLDVTLTGKVTTFLEAANPIPIPAPTSELTSPAKYWESNAPEIQELAQKYKTPRDIYDYVVGHLTYNYAKENGTVERLGAEGALANPTNSACQEFTDLFVAIARAAGIPARRVTGFAYTANSRLRPLGLISDVLHAWPEYFDKSSQKWVPIDPTWGNTTGGINYFDQFDFNHVVFAINGTSSTTPYAAGSYKRENQQSKDVDVKFGKDSPDPTQQFDITITKNTALSWPIESSYTISITNTSGVAWYNLPITLQTNNSSLQIDQAPKNLDYILPFQKKELTFFVKSPNVLASDPFTLTLKIGDVSSTHDLRTGLTFQNFDLVTPIVVGGSVVFIAFIAGSLLVPRRKR